MGTEPPPAASRPRPLRVAEPVLDEADRRAVLRALEDGWVSGYAPVVGAFEAAFAAWCGAGEGVATTSGTTALHLALAALGVGPGDEVILPAFAMVAVHNAVRWTGATPVLCDSRPDTWNLDPAAAAAAVGPRTRAILAVHTYGLPCDMAALRAVADRHGAALVEDAAEAHGARLAGRRAGALGDVACFSFFSNKLVTTGEGGMVVTSDAALAERCRRLRDLAKVPGGRPYLHREVGFQYRMPASCAALGLSQLRRAEEFLARRRRSARLYEALLADVEGLSFRPRAAEPEGSDWMTGVRVGPSFRVGRDELARRLAAEGIETRPFFLPIHRQPFAVPGERFPVAEALGDDGLVLPSGNDLGDEDVVRVAARVREGGRG